MQYSQIINMSDYSFYKDVFIRVYFDAFLQLVDRAESWRVKCLILDACSVIPCFDLTLLRKCILKNEICKILW